jgi:hypothetical protein
MDRVDSKGIDMVLTAQSVHRIACLPSGGGLRHAIWRNKQKSRNTGNANHGSGEGFKMVHVQLPINAIFIVYKRVFFLGGPITSMIRTFGLRQYDDAHFVQLFDVSYKSRTVAVRIGVEKHC